MAIPRVNFQNSETGCCPQFDWQEWDQKIMTFEGCKFTKALTKSFFYVPLNMGTIMKKTMEKISKAGAESNETYLILSRDLSKWSCEHYFLIEKEIPGESVESIEGQFLTKVFEGPYKELPKWIKAIESLARQKGHQPKETYAFYTTCPQCAKHYGKNYVVLFTRL